jgi:hypothetical protein
MTTVVVLQPGYLPWLGFFDQMRRCDVFVYYDDAQFDKNGWRNRNRIQTAQGPLWLTVPVLQSGRMGQRLCEVEIEHTQPWGAKHLRAIQQSYAKAPYLSAYFPGLEALLKRDWRLLVDLDLAAVELMCRWFGLERRTLRASTLGIGGGRSERLLSICRYLGATRYLSGSAAKDYLDVGLFADAGIGVVWQDYSHPIYPQLHNPFVPFMSALDLLLNVGPGSLAVVAKGTPTVTIDDQSPA